MARLTQTVAPASEPVTLAELKAHLRLPTADNTLAHSTTIPAQSASGTYSVTGDLVDSDGYRCRAIYQLNNASGSTSYQFTIQDSPDGSTWTSTNDYAAGLTIGDTNAQGAILYTGNQPYIRVLAEGTAANPLVISAVVQRDALIDDEDDLLDSLIVEARTYVEARLRRQLINATWRLDLDQFGMDDEPWCDEILLRRPKVSSVTSITYVDTDGATQTLSTAIYTSDLASEPARIKLAYGQSWPSIRSAGVYAPVKVTFVAGYGSAASSVPDGIKQYIKQRAAWHYEHRGDEAGATSFQTRMPDYLEGLLDPFDWGSLV